MGIPLNTYQRRFAENRVIFDPNLLSPALAEAVRRASLACAENQKTETGLIDFVCAMYLQFQTEFAHYFTGDFSVLVSQIFPVHRFGREGLIPRAFDEPTSQIHQGEAALSFSYSIKLTDELLQFLWSTVKLANAGGKDASLLDVVMALALNQQWTDELNRHGLKFNRPLPDFDKDVGTVVFFAPVHTGEGWPRKMSFERGTFRPPFTLAVSTPSGPFQPVRSAAVKLNKSAMASIEWPANPVSNIPVELKDSNTIEFELDGPPFGSIVVTVRGVPVK